MSVLTVRDGNFPLMGPGLYNSCASWVYTYPRLFRLHDVILRSFDIGLNNNGFSQIAGVDIFTCDRSGQNDALNFQCFLCGLFRREQKIISVGDEDELQ